MNKNHFGFYFVAAVSKIFYFGNAFLDSIHWKSIFSIVINWHFEILYSFKLAWIIVPFGIGKVNNHSNFSFKFLFQLQNLFQSPNFATLSLYLSCVVVMEGHFHWQNKTINKRRPRQFSFDPAIFGQSTRELRLVLNIHVNHFPVSFTNIYVTYPLLYANYWRLLSNNLSVQIRVCFGSQSQQFLKLLLWPFQRFRMGR